MISAEGIVKLFGKIKPIKIIRFGTVTVAGGKPRIRLDGETTASIKRYPYLGSYTPTVNDRVVIIHGIVFGKIVR